MAQADVIIGFDHAIDPTAAHDLEGALSGLAGVGEAHVDPNHRHLLQVRFDPEQVSAESCLDAVHAAGQDGGRLIGM